MSNTETTSTIQHPADSIWNHHIGNTPLLRLHHVTKHLPPTVKVLAKAEHLNPGGSVKDRPAWNMIRTGIESGALSPGKTLIDATSGNTGIAYAMIGASLGIPVVLALPSNASPARKQILKAYGAELMLTSPLEGTDGAQQVVKEQVAAYPERYFYPDQYNNDANWRAHFDTTGPEIWNQTGGTITHFVAGLGTTGTFMGVTRRLKQYNPVIQCHGLQPDSPLHGLEGLKDLKTARIPGIFDADVLDHFLYCSSDDAVIMMRRLAKEEGLLVGPSTGANVLGAVRVAETLEAGVVVTILCDTGTRYLGESF